MSDTPETDEAFLAAVHAISQDTKAAARMMGDYVRQRDELAAALRELVQIEYGPVEGLFRWRAAMEQAVAVLARIEEGKR